MRFRAACALLALLGMVSLGLVTADVAPGTVADELGLQAPARTVAAPLLRTTPPTERPAFRSLGEGEASYYGPGFEGNLTANGETFRMNGLTAAHRTLPFGSHVRVTNLRTGESVVVRINDRGPFVGDRVIDLSKGAARTIGMIQSGTAPVLLELRSDSNEA
ncbi:MAG: septal ring lytic transglycosylase RlpA family protein [Bacteroidota bacterium]